MPVQEAGFPVLWHIFQSVPFHDYRKMHFLHTLVKYFKVLDLFSLKALGNFKILFS